MFPIKLEKQLTSAIFVTLATYEFQTKKKQVRVYSEPSIDFQATDRQSQYNSTTIYIQNIHLNELQTLASNGNAISMTYLSRKDRQQQGDMLKSSKDKPFALLSAISKQKNNSDDNVRIRISLPAGEKNRSPNIASQTLFHFPPSSSTLVMAPFGTWRKRPPTSVVILMGRA